MRTLGQMHARTVSITIAVAFTAVGAPAPRPSAAAASVPGTASSAAASSTALVASVRPIGADSMEVSREAPSRTTRTIFPLFVSTSVTFASRYLFQGIDQCEGSSVVQPDLNAELGNLSLSIWLNHRLSGHRVTEVDVGAGYGWMAGAASITLAYAWLHYTGAGATDGHEGAIECSLDIPLQPSLSVHRDFGAGDGLYATAGLEACLTPRLAPRPLALACEAYHQSGYFGMTGWPGAQLSLSQSYPIGDFSLEPRVSYTAGWANGSFRGAASTPHRWTFAWTIRHEL